MCTVTFIACKRGYALGMNRDEKLLRAAGLPPARVNLDGRAVLCPSESGGGSWIAVNDHGVTLALINWYAVTRRVERNAVSRGEVVKAAAAAVSPGAVRAALSKLPLKRINPFRLVGVFPRTREIVEWRWDLERLVRKTARWGTQQWISSGFDEPAAQRIRDNSFRRALHRTATPDLPWLRRLHSSHAPCAGPFSTCMHRSDAATVSYTEITVSTRIATMRYRAGAPCMHSTGLREGLRLRLSNRPAPRQRLEALAC